MGFGNFIKRVQAYGLKPKKVRSIRKKLGLSGRSKFWRQLKRGVRGLKGGFLPNQQPVSASSVYQHQSRTLSQLTGGV